MEQSSRPWAGTASPAWNRGGTPYGNITVQFNGFEGEIKANLVYRVKTDDRMTEHDYQVGLASTLALGKYRRWWWVCPQCRHRAGMLYLPPREDRFLCRGCHDLTYQSCLDSHKKNPILGILGPRLLGEFGERFPGLTEGEIGKVLECELAGEEIPHKIEAKMQAGILARLLVSGLAGLEQPDSYAGYLTMEELIEQSGLSQEDLASLAEARLLLPDRPGGKYRPKLLGWARKLSYLLEEGWAIEEIKAWAKGRWQTPNPRAWPPEQGQWKSRNATGR